MERLVLARESKDCLGGVEDALYFCHEQKTASRALRNMKVSMIALAWEDAYG